MNNERQLKPLTKDRFEKTAATREAELFARDREAYLEKPLPSSPESERVVLGAILLDNLLIVQAMSMLSPDDFYSPIHRQVFKAMIAIHKANLMRPASERKTPIDPIQIGEIVRKWASLETIGGTASITNLSFGLPNFKDVYDFCKIIKEKSEIRQIITIAIEITNDALSEEYSPDELKARLQPRVALIGDGRLTETKTAAQVWDKVKERFGEWQTDGRVFSVPTGIPELNACLRLNGFAPRDLIFVAARPSIGKTALMLTFGMQAAMMQIKPLLFTLEMSEEDLFMRLLPSISGVKNMSINPTTLRKNPEARARLYAAGDWVAKLPIQFESQCFALDKMIAKAEKAVQREGVRVVYLDYLQLLKATTGDGSTAYGQRRRRDQELEEISRELKGFASRNNVPVICLAQLNRAVEIDDRRPEISDIREAGASEQDADLIILPYRPESRRKLNDAGKGRRRASIDAIVDRLDDESDEDKSVVKVSLYIGKQRNGRSNVEIPVEFDMDYQRFMTATLWREDRLDRLD